MAKFVLLGDSSKADTIKLKHGEVSGSIGIVKEPGDPDLDGYVGRLGNDSIATAEFIANPSTKAKPALPLQQMRTITIHARSPGTTSIEFFLPSAGATTLGKVTVTVEDWTDPADNDVDLFYLGQYLLWRRSLPPEGDTPKFLMFAATSGAKDFHFAFAQTAKDTGPIPAGRYSLLAQMDPRQSDTTKAQELLKDGEGEGRGPIKNTRPGIQVLPLESDGKPKYPDWGNMRVALSPLTPMPNNRSGFYLHDSHKGYTIGCVEARRDSAKKLFFDALLSYVKSGRTSRKSNLVLKVFYRDAMTSTLGDTVE